MLTITTSALAITYQKGGTMEGWNRVSIEYRGTHRKWMIAWRWVSLGSGGDRAYSALRCGEDSRVLLHWIWQSIFFCAAIIPDWKSNEGRGNEYTEKGPSFYCSSCGILRKGSHYHRITGCIFIPRAWVCRFLIIWPLYSDFKRRITHHRKHKGFLWLL